MEYHPYKQADNKFNLFNNYKFQYFLKNNIDITQYGGSYYTKGNDIFDMRTDYEYDDMNNNSSQCRTRIFIGNKANKVCLVGFIEPDNDTKILLETFSYFKECSVSENLERKTGVQNMMQAFVEYLQDNYPNVRKIELDDNSNFECGKIKIPTYPFYLFKYGSSYYEKIHNFRISDKNQLLDHEYNISVANNALLDISDFYNYMKIYLKGDAVNTSNFQAFVDKIIKYASVKELLNHYRFENAECIYFKQLLNYLILKYKIKPLSNTIYERIIPHKSDNTKSTRLTKKHIKEIKTKKNT